MGIELPLSIAADIAQVVTGTVATWAGIVVLKRARTRRQRLEEYLKDVRERDEKSGGFGLRTALHLAANLAMTESQVIDAAVSSTAIKAIVRADPDTGRADAIFYQYDKRRRRN